MPMFFPCETDSSIFVVCLFQLIHEDSDIADLALKCQSLLVQLFGGEHNHAMAQENMVSTDIRAHTAYTGWANRVSTIRPVV